jgi:pimeloyl-ACP methyl ester carboxylesterase
MSIAPELRYLHRAGQPLAAAHHRATGLEDPRRLAYWDWPCQEAGGTHAVICVHGLSRQGRDFDTLAAQLSRRARVVCPDMPGRGHSDWLADPMAYQIPTYVMDVAALIAELVNQGMTTIDWVGTSMGGLIGMVLAAQPQIPLRRMVLNDVGPAIEPDALLRIGTYLGKAPRFQTHQAAADYLWSISQSFGPHTEEQWAGLCQPMLRDDEGVLRLHYDPAIAEPFQAHTAETAAAAAAEGEAMLWRIYESLALPVLLIRGADSDLLSLATAQRMSETGPKATWVDVPGVGHAPTLIQPEQVALVDGFLFGA